MSAIRCDRADLAWALKAVLPHVLRERDFMPALEGVRLEADSAAQTLYAVATDRFTLGVARVDAAIDGAAATSLSRADIGEMLRRLKAEGECELAIYDDGEVCLDWKARWQKSTEVEFPDWRGIVGPALRRKPALPGRKLGWNTEFLARFPAAMRDNIPLVVMPTSRMTVVLGDHFTGLVMGARLTANLDAPAALRRWRELLPAEAAKETTGA